MRRHRKGGARFRQDTPPVKRARVNGEIKAQTVLVIDATGEQLGERSLPDALRLAAEAELDLVEVAAAAQPPVCRIVDYGKFRYDAERKEKLARRNQVRVAVKEVRLRPKIGEHDFAWKLDQVRGFLEQNAKVKIAVIFRGRERERPDRGRQLLDRIAAEVAADGAVEQAATFEGRSMFMVVAPTRAGRRGEQRVTGKQHAHAIARCAVSMLSAAPARGRGRRQRELAGVAALLADGLRDEAALAARAVGIRDLIEEARDEHLASLDADDGLQAISVDWAEVALLVAQMSLPRRNAAPRGRR